MKGFVLPATHPSDTTYGLVPTEDFRPLRVKQIRFDRQVWYNDDIRQDAFAQMQSKGLKTGDAVIGFSKSGLGALNIVLDHPGIFGTCVVFDSPMCRKELPPWETDSFYDQVSWERDLPLNRLQEVASFCQNGRLILISGDVFADEMNQFVKHLKPFDVAFEFLDVQCPHRWDSGWTKALRVFGREDEHVEG